MKRAFPDTLSGLGLELVRVASLPLLVLVALGVPPAVSGQERPPGREAPFEVLDLTEWRVDHAMAYLEQLGVRYRLDFRDEDPRTRIVVGQSWIDSLDRIAEAFSLELALVTEPRPGRPPPDTVYVEIPVQVPPEVVQLPPETVYVEVPIDVPPEIAQLPPETVYVEVPIEVPPQIVHVNRGVPWVGALAFAVATALLSIVGCRRLSGRREIDGEPRRPKGALPEFSAIVVDEAVVSTRERRGPAGDER